MVALRSSQHDKQEPSNNFQETHMRSLTMSALVAAALCAGALATTRADAASFGPVSGLGIAADAVDMTDNVQYVYGGRRHCWYPDGWHGPGWYWCGYRLRRGYGWGGPVGWNNWVYGRPVVVGPRRGPPPGPRYHRGPGYGPGPHHR
jgi:hypothetical protein